MPTPKGCDEDEVKSRTRDTGHFVGELFPNGSLCGRIHTDNNEKESEILSMTRMMFKPQKSMSEAGPCGWEDPLAECRMN